MLRFETSASRHPTRGCYDFRDSFKFGRLIHGLVRKVILAKRPRIIIDLGPNPSKDFDEVMTWIGEVMTWSRDLEFPP
jgi:hypothetical protein